MPGSVQVDRCDIKLIDCNNDRIHKGIYSPQQNRSWIHFDCDVSLGLASSEDLKCEDRSVFLCSGIESCGAAIGQFV